jgi:hypothetical protein
MKKFIVIGNDRIKLSNIKHYGIKYEDTIPDSDPFIRLVNGIFDLIAIFSKYTKVNRTIKVLFITTYQNDNFEFTGEEVEEKLRELDDYFNEK